MFTLRCTQRLQWKSVAAKVAGDLVVAPLGRDTVFFTGTQACAAFAHLRVIVEHERADPSVPYPTSTTLYRWRSGGWQRFDPTPLSLGREMCVSGGRGDVGGWEGPEDHGW